MKLVDNKKAIAGLFLLPIVGFGVWYFVFHKPSQSYFHGASVSTQKQESVQDGQGKIAVIPAVPSEQGALSVPAPGSPEAPSVGLPTASNEKAAPPVEV